MPASRRKIMICAVDTEQASNACSWYVDEVRMGRAGGQGVLLGGSRWPGRLTGRCVLARERRA